MNPFFPRTTGWPAAGLSPPCTTVDSTGLLAAAVANACGRYKVRENKVKFMTPLPPPPGGAHIG